MKKLVISFIFIIILIANRLTVFAGNIPGSLMHSEDAQIFFGKVLSYYPNEENQPIKVEILEVIKGNVKKDSKQTYFKAGSMGENNIRNGKVYLFIYYDEHNPTDVFEVTTYNTKTLKLKHTKGDMWERFEKYLNEGKYGEAKVEGIMPYIVDIIDGSLVFIFLISAVIIIVKRKELKKDNVKIKIFLILSIIFSILTLINGYLVIIHKLDNAGYLVVPMLFAITFSVLYRKEKNENDTSYITTTENDNKK